jgi:transposase
VLAVGVGQTGLTMPQLQLPIFPVGAKCITDGIAVECKDKQVVYIYGSLPVFQHDQEDLRSFRLFTSQLINMGSARQVDIVNAFGVPLPTVKRYLKLLRDRGPEAFFAEPGARSGSVLKGDKLQIVQSLLREGSSVPEAAQATGIAANTLHKAIRAGRLPAVKKNFPHRARKRSRPKANAAKSTVPH